jgi:hypothetical protein
VPAISAAIPETIRLRSASSRRAAGLDCDAQRVARGGVRELQQLAQCRGERRERAAAAWIAARGEDRRRVREPACTSPITRDLPSPGEPRITASRARCCMTASS